MARNRRLSRSPSPDPYDPDAPSPSQYLSEITLSQHPQTYELSQSLPEPKPNEKAKLSQKPFAVTAKAVTSLSRLLLFKALSGQAIDRRKCFEEALPPDIRSDRISNAILQEAELRLQNVWGLQIKSVPDFMANSLSAKYKDRFYVINPVSDPQGRHSLAIHNQEHTCEEKGLLMVVLALAFCKGTPVQSNAGTGERSKSEGDKTSIYTARWIHDVDLYRLLNNLDDTIPDEPPRHNVAKAGSKRKSVSSSAPSPAKNRRARTSNMIDVETLLEKFVSMDYLLKKKSMEFFRSSSQDESRNAALSEDGFSYAMGPRAALEIGRRQLVYFCADIMGQQPDPTMLEEIDDEGVDDEDEGIENEE